MRINIPTILNEEPTKQYLKEVLGVSNKQMHVALHIANRVWVRTKCGEAQNWKCCWCGISTDKPSSGNKSAATLEHVIPRSKGGQDIFEDCALACAGCNNSRGDMDADTFYEKGMAGHSNHSTVKQKRKVRQQLRTDKKAFRGAFKHWSNNWINSKGEQMSINEWIQSVKISENAKKQILYTFS